MVNKKLKKLSRVASILLITVFLMACNAVISPSGPDKALTLEEAIPIRQGNQNGSLSGAVFFPIGSNTGSLEILMSWGANTDYPGTRSLSGIDQSGIRSAGIGVRNIAQIIAVDAAVPDKIWAFSEGIQKKTSEKTITMCIDVLQGHSYHFLLLMGHKERRYGEMGEAITYEDAKPTLLAAGYVLYTAQAGHSMVDIPMNALVMDVQFMDNSGTLVQPVIGQKSVLRYFLPRVTGSSIGPLMYRFLLIIRTALSGPSTWPWNTLPLV